MKLRAKEAKKKLPPPPPPSDKAGLSLLRAPRITGAVPPNPFRREQPPPMVSGKVTPPVNPFRQLSPQRLVPPMVSDTGGQLPGDLPPTRQEALRASFQTQQPLAEIV